MTLIRVNARRTLGMFLAVVLLFGVTSVIASQNAVAAYPGGTGWLVFESGSDLYAMPADGSGVPVNMSAASADADPVFSPDGTQIAFTRDIAGSSIYVADFNPAGPSLGTPTRISSGGVDGEPTWSPDGAWLAYQRRVVTTIASGTADNPVPGADLIDSGAAFVTTSGVVTGDKVRNTATSETGTVATVTDTTITLVTPLATDWTAGNGYEIEHSTKRQILKSQSSGLNLSTAVLSATGSELLYDDQDPVWSPAGTLIAFTTNRNGNSDVYVFGTDGTSPVNLTTTGLGYDDHASRPSWSPDGSRIAFQSAEPNGAHSNIWSVTPAAIGHTQVTGSFSGGNGDTGTDADVEAAWSPNGTKIAFRRAGTGGNVTWTVPVSATGAATGPVVKVTTSVVAPTHEEVDWQPVLTGVADAGSVDERRDVTVDVLANDLVLSSTDPITSGPTAQPPHGTVNRETDGSFTYTHDGAEIGVGPVVDTFEYTVTQGSASSTAVVTITINPVDDSPSAVADAYNVSNAATINIAAVDGVLANDTDPEGLGLSAVLVGDVANGTLALAANGSFTYTHDGSATLADSFTYQAKDPGNNLSAVTTVSLAVGPLNPDPPAVTLSGPSFGAPGIMATFTSSIADGSGPRVYDWTITHNGTDVGQGTNATVDYTPAVTGLHTVTLTVADDAGTDTDTVDFTVMTDIGSSIFVANILWLAEEGITAGCNPPTNDAFCPEDRVTRGQMAAFLVRFLGLTDDGGGDLFTDDDNSIFEANIDKLATAGITAGCNAAGDEFCPDDFVTRGQMAAFLVRALGLTDDGGGDLFTDDDNSIFEANIDKLATAGITKGCNAAGDQFCPDGFVTRGQMAAFLQRADGLK